MSDPAVSVEPSRPAPDETRSVVKAAGLIGVAEAYDAMTHARSYHATLDPHEARGEVLRLRGVQFLPRAVDALLQVIPA